MADTPAAAAIARAHKAMAQSKVLRERAVSLVARSQEILSKADRALLAPVPRGTDNEHRAIVLPRN
jgi:hypothetical protein